MIRTVNNLFVTEAMTFPRSGHHWLFAVLKDYFGGRLVECVPAYGERIEQGGFTNFQRCFHDWNLDLPVVGDRQYLVQVRDPIDALQSRFEVEHVPQLEWREKMKQWVRYYAGFMAKWVYSDIPRRLIVRYEDLCAAPVAWMEQVVLFLEANGGCDTDRLANVLEKYPANKRERITLGGGYV